MTSVWTSEQGDLRAAGQSEALSGRRKARPQRQHSSNTNAAATSSA